VVSMPLWAFVALIVELVVLIGWLGVLLWRRP
jgi:hypothetical protein